MATRRTVRSSRPGKRGGKSKAVSIDAKRRVFDSFLKIDEITVSFDRLAGKGRIKGQKRLVMERGDAAAVLLHETDTDTVLLTEQVRVPTIAKGPGIIREVVAGMIAAGETPEACIRREIEEEIGYRAGKGTLKRIGTFYVSPGGTSERIVLFYARVKASQRVKPDASGVAGEGEDIRLAKVKRTAFVKQALGGKIDDAKTLVAGLWLAAKNP